MLKKNELAELEGLARGFRKRLIQLLYTAQSGHPGGSLSATEILTALYFHTMAAQGGGKDRFVLSKGHAAPMLYIILAEKGWFPREELDSLRRIDSRMQGHPCAHKTPGVNFSAGPLGLGLSGGLGIALAQKRQGGGRTYVLMGDGELNEGTVWEAAMSAAKFGAGNLVAIVDNNGVQLDGTTDEIMPMGDIAAKFASFGWETYSCDGHDLRALCDALDMAQAGSAPKLIVAKTVKGKGVSFMEGKNIWHGRVMNGEEYSKAMEELEAADIE